MKREKRARGMRRGWPGGMLGPGLLAATLEITRREEGVVTRERRLLSGEALADLREAVAGRMAEAGASARLGQAGRGGLVLA